MGCCTIIVQAKTSTENLLNFWAVLIILPYGLFTLHWNRTGTGNRVNAFLYIIQKCSQWCKTGTGTRTYFFLLCQSRSLYLSRSRFRAVWITHNTGANFTHIVAESLLDKHHTGDLFLLPGNSFGCLCHVVFYFKMSNMVNYKLFVYIRRGRLTKSYL